MIQNMIRPVIQIYHSTLELTVVFTYLLFIFSCRCYNLIKEHVYYFFSNLLFYWFRVYKYSNVFSLNFFLHCLFPLDLIYLHFEFHFCFVFSGSLYLLYFYNILCTIKIIATLFSYIFALVMIRLMIVINFLD